MLPSNYFFYGVMLIDRARVTTLPKLSFNQIVKLDVPALVGVPEMTPVALLSERPRGREPGIIDQV